MIGHLKRLNTLRKRSGLTQARIASLLGVSQANVVRMELAPDSVTLGQADGWLQGCGFPEFPNINFMQALGRVGIDPVHDFLLGIDAVSRTSSAAVQLHRKPRLVIFANSAGDQRVTVGLLRDLLNTGEHAFNGFLMPSDNKTIVFKHVSERPSAFDQAAYVLSGVLRDVHVVSPLDHLDVARDADGNPRAGSFMVLEDEGPDTAAVVYADHPLLRLVDVVRPGAPSEGPQSLFDLQLAAGAEILVACCGARAVPSPGLMILACLAANPIKFLVCPAVVDPRRVLELLETIERRTPTKLILDERFVLDPGNAAPLASLAAAAQQADDAYCAAHRAALDHRQLPANLPMPIGRGDRCERAKDHSPLAAFIGAKLVEEERKSGALGAIAVGFQILSAFHEADRGNINWDLPQEKYETTLLRRKRHETATLLAELEAFAPQPAEVPGAALIYALWQLTGLSRQPGDATPL